MPIKERKGAIKPRRCSLVSLKSRLNKFLFFIWQHCPIRNWMQGHVSESTGPPGKSPSQDTEYSSLCQSRTLLFIHSIYTGLYLLTPSSHSIPSLRPSFCFMLPSFQTLKKQLWQSTQNIKFTILNIFRVQFSGIKYYTFTSLCNHHHRPSPEFSPSCKDDSLYPWKH